MNPDSDYVGNLLENLHRKSGEEEFLTLVQAGNCRIERIVSHGHATPAGEWYDQQDHEWVAVLTGAARLLFEEGHRRLEMKPGDHVFIPAGCRHRVEWTDPDTPTVWLAVHCGPHPLAW